MKKFIFSVGLVFVIASITACSDEEVKDSNVVKEEESRDENTSEPIDQNKESEETKSEEDTPEILTIENNEDLAALLALKDEYDASVGEFAEKYKGQTIQFNAHIASVAPHGDSKTRYDFLIYVGDYGETSFFGPVFQFKDVNIFDMKITNSEIPDYIKEQQNLIVTAEVEKYDENSGLFFLNPVFTELKEPIK